MRIDGTLKTWNDSKGYGFITPNNGGQDIFVHVSDYPRRGGKPKLAEALSFEIQLNPDGKKKAINVQRPAAAAKQRTGKRSSERVQQSGRGFLGRLVSVILLVVICAIAYNYAAPKFKNPSPENVSAQPLSSTATTPRPSPWRCDGRTHCSQMTSCDEATYFLRNCPGVEMDGDGDGTPCEQQWCTSPFAK